MALLPPNVDFTSKDFRALRLRLQGLIRSVFPEWTSFSTASFGNLLLESFAYVGDVLTFYQDNQARESFWSTVTQRVNAIRLGALIEFELASARSATGVVRFSIPATHAEIIPISAGTRVKTPDINGVRFRTLAASVIPIGQLFVDVAVEQAVRIVGESFTSSLGPNQTYTTIQAPYIDASFEITATDGVYLEVDSFLDPDPLTGEAIGSASRVFVARADQFGRGNVIFGDGQTGKIPEGDVVANYKIGGGSIGNVEVNTISLLEDTLVDSPSNDPQDVSVTNLAVMTGGVDAMSVAQARRLGPASLRLRERSVVREDFEIAALLVPSVARAVMITSNEDAAVEENEGVVAVVSKGERLTSGRIAPATPSVTTLEEVETKIRTDFPPTLTFSFTVIAAPFKTINVSVRVFLKSGASTADVGLAVREAIKDFFAAQLDDGTANPDMDFGANIKQADGTVISEIAWSDVFNSIRDVSGVRKVDEGPQGLLLNLLRSSVPLSPRQFPKVGTIQVIDAATGGGI